MLYAQTTTHSVTLTVTAPSSGDTPATYNILRSLTSGTETQYASIPFNGTTTTYVDTAVTGGTTYFYTAKAVNSAGTSAASNEVSAAVPLAVPGAPGLAVASKQ